MRKIQSIDENLQSYVEIISLLEKDKDLDVYEESLEQLQKLEQLVKKYEYECLLTEKSE